MLASNRKPLIASGDVVCTCVVSKKKVLDRGYSSRSICNLHLPLHFVLSHLIVYFTPRFHFFTIRFCFSLYRSSGLEHQSRTAFLIDCIYVQLLSLYISILCFCLYLAFLSACLHRFVCCGHLLLFTVFHVCRCCSCMSICF